MLFMRAILFLLAVAAASPASTLYSVTDLGSLGGGSAVAFSLNGSGTIVGWAQTVSGIQSAVLSTGGLFQVLPPLSGGMDTYAYGINASGTVVGISYINGQAHGEVWSGGATQDLGAGVFATGINDGGAIIGGNGHAFVLANGAFRDLGVLPGGDWSAAYGINTSGTVVGYGTAGSGIFRAFVWTPQNGMQELGTLGGANSYATAVNNSGEVVGHASLANQYQHAFLAVGAMMTDLGTLGGGNSYAYGINDSGSIVGYSDLASGAYPHAFLYSQGVMLDLNSLIPAGSSWQLLEAYGINNAGQIVGEGLWNGQMHAFRLEPLPGGSLGAQLVQPVPDPGTASLAGIGLGLILTGVWHRRRRNKPQV